MCYEKQLTKINFVILYFEGDESNFLSRLVARLVRAFDCYVGCMGSIQYMYTLLWQIKSIPLFDQNDK